jgi:putative hydrolase of HD superfamily
LIPRKVKRVESSEADRIAQLIHEAGVLKLLPRTGWAYCGIRSPESVAEHSFRTALIAGLIAKAEGADPARATYLAVWHDTQETRVLDIPHLGRKYLDAASNETVTADQVSGLPEGVAADVRALVREYESAETLEAKCARDADRLECLFQAIEYRDAGARNVDGWIESSRSTLRTMTGKQIADAAMSQESSQKWHSEAIR